MKSLCLLFYAMIACFYVNAQVAVGTTTPYSNTQLTVVGNAATTTGIRASSGYPSFSFSVYPGVYGESSNAPGVVGVSQNQNGVLGASGVNNYAGVAGSNSAATGYGIWGSVSGTGTAGYFDGGLNSGVGIAVIRGGVGIGTGLPIGRLVVQQTGTTGIDTAAAIYGYSNSTVSSYKGGVFGTYNTSNYGTGIQGIGYQGVLFSDAPASFPNVTASTDVGVYGSGATAGVIGTSLAGSGVRGFSSTSQGILGYSQAATTGGAVGVGHTIGVFANAVTVGSLAPPTTRYGVYGQASGATTNWAGYFNGNVNIIGSIAKGSGTFKIDHPLDPENKYLYHSFVESPDMMNIYNGNIVTDGQGYATVKLPDYFDALNKEFRYQLTVIGAFAQAIIKDEINGNSFRIQTNEPNVKVSWQVTGVRKDKFAEAHRIVPEVEKEKENKGRYIHAAEWGQPQSKEINYEINHAAEIEAKKQPAKGL